MSHLTQLTQVEEEILAIQDKGSLNWSHEEVIRLCQIKSEFPDLFYRCFQGWKRKGLLDWPKPAVKKIQPKIVLCEDLHGRCCPDCHQEEGEDGLGLAVYDLKDGYLLACCFKANIYSDQMGMAVGKRGNKRLGYRLDWKTVRAIRNLYGKPEPGRGNSSVYTIRKLAAKFGLNYGLIFRIVKNRIWQE